MHNVAYFAHEWTDAAIRRRVAALQDDGLKVSGFAMTRDYGDAPDWVVAKLGKTKDNAYLQRITSILTGAWKARKHREHLKAADVIIARNLDMLATAMLARKLCGLKTPVIYECLDIHRLMVRGDIIGKLFRHLEGAMLKNTSALWVSSPGFLRNYFEPFQKDNYNAQLIENRLTQGGNLSPRPENQPDIAPDGVLRIGWIGNLRCPRSMDLLDQLGRDFAGRVTLKFHGYPALTEIPDFQARVDANPAIEFAGRYKAPDDLASIYNGLDVVWSGDFMDAGFNSDWLLPNRVYEGGWFGCPPIAPAACETGRMVDEANTGFTVDERIEETLPALIDNLLGDPSEIANARARLLALPDENFVQPKGTLKALLKAAISA